MEHAVRNQMAPKLIVRRARGIDSFRAPTDFPRGVDVRGQVVEKKDLSACVPVAFSKAR